MVILGLILVGGVRASFMALGLGSWLCVDRWIAHAVLDCLWLEIRLELLIGQTFGMRGDVGPYVHGCMRACPFGLGQEFGFLMIDALGIGFDLLLVGSGVDIW